MYIHVHIWQTCMTLLYMTSSIHIHSRRSSGFKWLQIPTFWMSIPMFPMRRSHRRSVIGTKTRRKFRQSWSFLFTSPAAVVFLTPSLLLKGEGVLIRKGGLNPQKSHTTYKRATPHAKKALSPSPPPTSDPTYMNVPYIHSWLAVCIWGCYDW